MLYQLLIALGAGLVSAVVFASATTGPMIMRLVLFLMTPLALFLAGLGLGPVAAIVAGVTGTLLVTAAGGLKVGVYFAASSAIPVIVLAYLASLNRRTADGNLEWYPPGRMVMAAALLAGAFAALTLFLLGSDLDELRTNMRAGLDQLVNVQLATVPDAPKLTSQELDELANIVVALLPAALGLWAMTSLLFNFWLAGRITLASGRLRRPWPDLAGITYSPLMPALLALTTGVGFVGGVPGMIAVGFAGPLLLAYVLLGIAIIHYVTRGNAWRPFQLFVLYFSLILLYPLAPLAIALLAFADAIWPMRRRAAPRQGPPRT